MYLCIERERERMSNTCGLFRCTLNIMQKKTQCQFSCLADLQRIKDNESKKEREVKLKTFYLLLKTI